MRKYLLNIAAPVALVACANPALANSPPPQKFGDPISVGDGLTLDPIAEGRLRWEHVDQPATDADAVTFRLRLGGELKHVKSQLSFLAEAEGTAAIDNSYNAFSFANTSSQRRTQFSTIADPENIEINRLQFQYKGKALAITVGRQRIALDDQRFVGAVGSRQNEQTFDAVRAEAKIGKFTFDGTYSTSQRTVFGRDAGPRLAYDGNFVFLTAGASLGSLNIKPFAYLFDYAGVEQAAALAVLLADTQTYGTRATFRLDLSKVVKLNLAASFARQTNYQQNPLRYSVDYYAAEAGIAHKGLIANFGYEQLGASGLVGRSFQTPMATLNKFNGWADLFLTTPTNGLKDIYGGLAYAFTNGSPLRGLNAAVTYHQYYSHLGSVNFGHEWNASVGRKLAPRVNGLMKFADYKARGFGTDTKKFSLQLEFAY
jgi:hypothetical protein